MKRSTQIFLLVLAALAAGWYFLLYRPSQAATATGARPASAARPNAGKAAQASASAAKPSAQASALAATATGAARYVGNPSPNNSGVSIGIDLTDGIKAIGKLIGDAVKHLAEFAGWTANMQERDKRNAEAYATGHGFTQDEVSAMRSSGMTSKEIGAAADALSALTLAQANGLNGWDAQLSETPTPSPSPSEPGSAAPDQADTVWGNAWDQRLSEGAVNAGSAPSFDSSVPAEMSNYIGGWDGLDSNGQMDYESDYWTGTKYDTGDLNTGSGSYYSGGWGSPGTWASPMMGGGWWAPSFPGY